MCQKLDSFRMEPRTRASILSVFMIRLLMIMGTQGNAPALLTMTEKGSMLSPICRLSHGAYDRYRLDANGRVRTDAELAEYVEDRVRKTAEYQRDHMTSGISSKR